MTVSYHEKFQQLDTAVQRLSQGNIPLKEAFSLYEKSLGLLEECQHYLEKMDQAFLAITESTPSKETEQSLDELLKKLELSIREFESCDSIEEALLHFSTGMNVIRQSQDLLQNYEQNIVLLSKSDMGVTEILFEAQKDGSHV